MVIGWFRRAATARDVVRATSGRIPAEAAEADDGVMTLPGLTPIGTIRTARTSLADTPVQAPLNPDETGVVELDAGFAEGLDGLAGFDHCWLLTWLGRDGDALGAAAPLRQVPFLLAREGTQVGTFAIRSPRRPNPIGLSLVRILAVEGATLRFAGVDMLDGTPVLDIKPYIPRVDVAPGTPRAGWTEAAALPTGGTPRSLAAPDGER